MNSNGRQPQTIKSGISQQQLIGSSSSLKLKLRGANQNLEFKILQLQITSNGRQPDNTKSGISEHPLIGST